MKCILFLSILSFLTAWNQIMQSQKNAQWRGPDRDGIYPGKNLLKLWPESGPKLLWMSEVIGNGYGSAAVTGDKLFINGEIDSVSYVFAFGLDGKLIWKSPNGPGIFRKWFFGQFSRSTLYTHG